MDSVSSVPTPITPFLYLHSYTRVKIQPLTKLTITTQERIIKPKTINGESNNITIIQTIIGQLEFLSEAMKNK